MGCSCGTLPSSEAARLRAGASVFVLLGRSFSAIGLLRKRGRSNEAASLCAGPDLHAMLSPAEVVDLISWVEDWLDEQS
jgi:hypothetical protein